MISDLKELRSWYGRQIQDIEVDNYRIPFQDLAHEGTLNILELIRKKGFEWGATIPESVTMEDIFACIKEFEN